MKLKPLLNRLLEDVDQDAMSSANALLLVDKIKSNPEIMKLLSQLQMPTDKYKAIVRFAGLLGVPEVRFDDFMSNIKAHVQNGENGQYLTGGEE
jgi:hypothetical protein